LDGETGPAKQIDAERSRALVAGALELVLAERAGPAPEQPQPNDSTPRREHTPGARVIPLRRRSPLWAAGVLVAGSAAATIGHHQWSKSHEPVAVILEPNADAPAPRTLPRAIPRPNANEEAENERADSDEARSTPSAAEEPPSETEKTGNEEQGAPDPARIAPALSAQPPGKAANAQPKVAADLLGKANTARGSGKYAAALKLYQDVMRRFPSTRQADAARLAVASLRLEHFGDVEGAERLFDEGTKRGTMSAEALYGLADAKRRRGDHDAELAVLQRLVREHPNSPLSRSASKRIQSLQQ
jgi:tetratricopeptide (TPR) repeat protein